MVRSSRVIGVRATNGEKHYVVQSLEGNEDPANYKDFDEAEVKRIMEKEASESLLLLRAE